MARKFSRRAFLKMAGVATLGSVGTGTYGFAIEPNWVVVTPVRLVLPRLTPEFHGYRIAQISDIHMDGIMTADRLAGIARLINQQAPDLVVITGDFVTRAPAVTYTKGLADVLRLLTPHDATLAILGNHDHWTDARLIRQLIREGGAIDISNAVYTVRRGTRQLHIGGVDDIWEHKDDLPKVLKALPGDEAAILLAHEPDFADTSAATGRFDLQLSGHSHGGQVAIPLLGPPILPHLARKYPKGLYQVGSMFQYTNRGLGAVNPRVRFNCRPEITLFTLESPQA